MPDLAMNSLPTHYRAWRWLGSADPLDLAPAQLSLPALAPGEVLVRNRVIGLNPVDWKVLSGSVPTWKPGHIPGVDGAGEVLAVGEGVSKDWLGSRVAYHTSLHGHGSFAEFTPVASRALLQLPEALDFERAASVPCPALTAWLALEKLPLKPGQRLLISGAGGAVGNYLVQLAAQRGFAVTAMSHSRHRDRLRALGAPSWLPGPLTGETAADGPSFHAVIDCVSEAHAAALAPWLGASGHLVCVQGRVPQWPCEPFGRTLSLHEVALGALHLHGNDADWAALVAAGNALLEDIAQGELTPQTSRVCDFDALPALLGALRSRDFFDKPLVRVP